MKEEIDQEAVNNFIAKMDLSLPCEFHLYKAYINGLVFEWNEQTLYKIKDEVLEIYNKIKIDKARQ